MAKWGEGDPRWIVEERADAKNVNNWHWTEKNASPWSVEKIRSLLTGFTIDSDKYFVEITEVSKCEGEAHANNRKGRLIIFYDWDVEMQWKGHRKGSDGPNKAKGTITCVNLSEENSADELYFEVSCSTSRPGDDEIKEFIRKEGVGLLRKQFEIYINELRHEYSKDLILPTAANQGSVTIKESSTEKQLLDGLQKSNNSASKKEQNSENKTQKSVQIFLEEDFMCTPDDLFKVFVTEELTKHFTRDNATVEASPGGRYSIFGGNVSGNFIKLDTNKLITMSWRKSNWPEGHISSVKLEFERSETGTKLKLTQTNVPASDSEGTKVGWNTHYFLPIQQTFGFGGKIF